MYQRSELSLTSGESPEGACKEEGKGEKERLTSSLL